MKRFIIPPEMQGTLMAPHNGFSNEDTHHASLLIDNDFSMWKELVASETRPACVRVASLVRKYVRDNRPGDISARKIRVSELYTHVLRRRREYQEDKHRASIR